MAQVELVQTLDYILNGCNERDIEVIAAAVVRRRRELAMFGGRAPVPDAGRLAKEVNSQLNVEGSIEGLKQGIRDYAIRIIRQEAPELTDEQIDELTRAWIPGSPAGPPHQGSAATAPRGNSLPRDLLSSMIDQFVSFSLGRMEEEEDSALRKDIGPWPDKYWKAFPQVIRLLITDFLKGEMNEGDFNTRIGLALSMK
jgi:hypothetical protein